MGGPAIVMSKELIQTLSQSQSTEGREQALDFESWYSEGKKKRYIFIRFMIKDSSFKVTMAGDDTLYTIPAIIHHKNHQPIRVWDLYVGAEIDVLGRITTLRHCSENTSEWNSYWAEVLLDTRRRLQMEVLKYDSRKMERWLPSPPTVKLKGAWNLRLLMQQVIALQGRLAEHRPLLAERLTVPPEMFEIENLSGREDIDDE